MASEVWNPKNYAKKLPRWKTVFRARGIGGWPPISTWINPPSLGSNGLHCVEFSGERGKRLLNLNLGELLALLETSCLGLWKVVMNLLLAGLTLFNQSGYMR
jgi:hypothetical protein